MIIEMEVKALKPVVVINKEEYDLLREKAHLFNQVCDIQRQQKAGGFKYDSDYKEALEVILDELTEVDNE